MEQIRIRKRNAGNALWFILIAIFLLAALTMLITRTNMQTEETGDSERVAIGVSELLRYTTSVKSTVQKMLLNGISENQISFANDVYQECDDDPIQPAGHNPRCLNAECEIFSVDGGGLKPIEIPESIKTEAACTTWKAGAMVLSLKTIDGVGADNTDELLLEVSGLTREACVKINSMVGIPAVSGDAPEDDIGAISLFSGTYTTGGTRIGDQVADFIGQKSLCLKDSSDGYNFFTVLIAK
jgi:hypothetical protein